MLLPGAHSLGEDYRNRAASGKTILALSAALRAAHWFEQQGDFRNAGVWHREVYYSVYLHNNPRTRLNPPASTGTIRSCGHRALFLIQEAKRALLGLSFYKAIKTLAEAEDFLASSNDDLLWARFYACRALCQDRLRDVDAAAADYERAVELMIGAGDYARAANYLNCIGFSLAENQHWEKGEQYLLKGLEVLEKATLWHVQGALYDSLGYTYTMMSDFEKAEMFLTRATSLFESSPDPLSRLGSNLRLYAFHVATRNYSAARVVADRSLDLATGLGSQPLLSQITRRFSFFDSGPARSRLQRFHGILYLADAVQGIVSQVRIVAPTEEPVLLLGETGTGKELVARAVHLESNRSRGPFVPFNCSTAIKGLAESQLFGHVKGAFTDAKVNQDGTIRAAEGGTIFFDEIGDLDPSTQASLLRFLQTGEVQPVGARCPLRIPVRVIAATNRDLKQAVLNRLFRLDLFHRLNVITLTLPPLRDRTADILLLTRYFLEDYSQRYRCLTPVVGEQEKDLLLSYPWPGNVRELENYAKRRALFGEQAIAWLREQISEQKISALDEDSDPGWRRLPVSEKIDRINSALDRCGGNLTHAARLLGISRRTIQILRKRNGRAGSS
jgi:DNA-binding NtrC family response regulator/Tfp pilus assembly protein PilF